MAQLVADSTDAGAPQPVPPAPQPSRREGVPRPGLSISVTRLTALRLAAGPPLQWLLVGALGLAAGGALAGRATPSWLAVLLWCAGVGNLLLATGASGRTAGWWAAAAIVALLERMAALAGLTSVRETLTLAAFVVALRAFSLLYERQGLHKRYARPDGPLFRSTG